MDIEEIKQYCLTKTGAIEDYPFGPDPMVIKVCSKIFGIISMKSEQLSLSLKCDPFLAVSLRQEHTAITAGYHLNKEHWNTVILNGTVSDKDLRWLIDHSYDLVHKSLTKAEKQHLQGK